MTNNSISPEQMMGMFTIKMTSSLKAQEIASQMEVACIQYNFSLLQQYNFHEIIESKGFSLDRKVYVFEICQAKMAAKVLADNPEFSIFMPCKIAVYEQDDETIISTMNMEMMLKVFENNTELYTEALALFETLQKLMDSLR